MEISCRQFYCISWMGLFQKKDIPLLINPLKFSGSSTPTNSTKNTPWKLPNKEWTPENSISFLINPWKFCISISSQPLGKSVFSTSFFYFYFLGQLMVIKNQLLQLMVKGVYGMVLYMYLLYIILFVFVWQQLKFNWTEETFD